MYSCIFPPLYNKVVFLKLKLQNIILGFNLSNVNIDSFLPLLWEETQYSFFIIWFWGVEPDIIHVLSLYVVYFNCLFFKIIIRLMNNEPASRSTIRLNMWIVLSRSTWKWKVWKVIETQFVSNFNHLLKMREHTKNDRVSSPQSSSSSSSLFSKQSNFKS